jgi:hypothetical protein
LWIQPRRDLRESFGLGGVPRKVPKALGSKGLDHMATVKSPTIYIERKPYVLEPLAIVTKLPPLGLRQERAPSPRNKRDKGLLPHRLAAAVIAMLLPPMASSVVAMTITTVSSEILLSINHFTKIFITMYMCQ